MKKTIALLTTLITLVTLVVFISTASAASPAGCPAGYICTPTVPVAAVVCPVGYVCTRNNTTTTTNTSTTNLSTTNTSTYIPGSFYRAYLSGAGSRGTTNTSATTNRTASSTSVSSTSTTVIDTSNTEVTNSGIDMTGSSQWWKSVPTWSVTERCTKNSAYAGPTPKSMGGFVPTYGGEVPDLECFNKTTQEVLSENLDPYWTDKTDPIGFVGEASKQAVYNNPWLSASNPLGIMYASRAGNTAARAGYSKIASNLCRNPVSLAEAKTLQATLLASGSQKNILGSSTLYVFGPTNLLWYLEVYGAEVMSPLSANQYDGQLLSWDGTAETHRFNALDWSKPEFQTLIQNYPPLYGGSASPSEVSTGVARCLDDGYKSNFPQWANHFMGKWGGAQTDQWAIWKAAGLVQ